MRRSTRFSSDSSYQMSSLLSEFGSNVVPYSFRDQRKNFASEPQLVYASL